MTASQASTLAYMPQFRKWITVKVDHIDIMRKGMKFFFLMQRIHRKQSLLVSRSTNTLDLFLDTSWAPNTDCNKQDTFPLLKMLRNQQEIQTPQQEYSVDLQYRGGKVKGHSAQPQRTRPPGRGSIRASGCRPGDCGGKGSRGECSSRWTSMGKDLGRQKGVGHSDEAASTQILCALVRLL